MSDPPSERAFPHGVKQDTKSLFSRNRFIGTCVAFPEIASAFFAFVSLLSGRHATFDSLL
jgi:hypothetical protein